MNTFMIREYRTLGDARLKSYYDKDCCNTTDQIITEGFVNNSGSRAESSVKITGRPSMGRSYVAGHRENFEPIENILPSSQPAPKCSDNQIPVLSRYCVIPTEYPCNT